VNARAHEGPLPYGVSVSAVELWEAVEAADASRVSDLLKAGVSPEVLTILARPRSTQPRSGETLPSFEY
jgi:hypothetical protein